jgi:hypothetical protein
VGLMIAEKWHLGSSLRGSLAHHHAPEEADGADRELVTLVSLGNAYANLLGKGSPITLRSDESVFSSLLEKAGLSPHALAGYEGKVLDEIEKARVFIQLSKKG